MLQFQQPNGRIPEMIFWENKTKIQEESILTMYSNVQYTDITQMPVLPWSLRAIYNASQDVSILKEFLPPLVNYFTWWLKERAIDGDNLVYIIHNWESGLDASPIYDPTFNITDPQPDYNDLHPQFDELCYDYNWQYNWNVTEILARTERPDINYTNWFFVKDVGVNAIFPLVGEF